MAPRPDDPFAPRREDDQPPDIPPEFGFRPGIPPPFRLDSASVARIPLPAERDLPPLPEAFVPRAYPRDRVWLHIGLFVVTLLTTTVVGAEHYASFASDFGARRVAINWWLLVQGLWYSLTILAILGAHEFGHYFACRYYHVNASLPYFIPVPPDIFITGTAGAVIRIRQGIPSKRVLFDVGIAGPLAGFVIAVPTLFIGVALSRVVPLPPDFSGLDLGEPLLLKAAAWLFWSHVPDGYTLSMHPMAFAAWFGLIATVLNLLPVFQLDGGHISYAVFGRRSIIVTWITLAALVVLCFVAVFWILWTVLLIGMVLWFGPRHPPTIDDDEPLDRARLILAVVAVVVFILAFTPAPIQPINLLTK